MIKAVLFDLDGTLVDREAGAAGWLRAQFDDFETPKGDFEMFLTRFQELDARGHTSKLETFAQLAAEWKWGRSADEIWTSYRRDVGLYCTLFPDAIPTLQTLQQNGFPLAIVTNGTVECQSAKIESLGLSAWIDAALISEREGFKKPAPELFWRACETLRVQPEEALMVGDSFKADVEGARRAGLHAVFLSRDKLKENDVLTLSSLSQISSVITSAI
jgi:putative hydrolase of the HAD superfamily